jgi:hypothetical protein
MDPVHLTAVILALIAATGAPADTVKVGLRVRVAECADSSGKRLPARSPDWVKAHVQAVQELLSPHGIAVTARSDAFEADPCEILSREDRDRFARHVTMDQAVTVLVVPRVRDLDVLTYNLQGVHWRAKGRRWIFLTARSRPPTLAHELCHYFGLPHDPEGGNLMTPGPSSPAWRSPRPPRPFEPRLTDAQVQRLRAGIRRFLAQAQASSAPM